ncbi:MAG: AmmeMemoRadiSam system radical SAM enzyme [Candidatus Omnitrophota bacterium]|nr:AmmeMemoRadiSam system radical SAM enzyme [Candidatus Omnitrophota bacterium]MBU1928535.1 AmmeMemoRadiSam system radical SAM enzyme [Candidatus Omnitrophota bacterium]MBU2034998.1 AmmeMemoRadiSam system radical SAM enzyme [Candidatus Omnitrophota bacterium]MBU2221457.1 AmmeMemoRadiSam system radical SAM enzyme [Candidatus Omnitrophota bacterium]MBU2258028.1 AmmeMemoRadiSam system radical SAM enzyme [Candidatus Omnitrophota bacterium]
MKNVTGCFIAIIFFICLIGLSISLPGIFAFDQDKEALYYQKLDKKSVQCRLCPRQCVISKGLRGYCGIRENRDGVLYALSYAKPVAVHLDPIEKKPLFHFLPGSQAFSIATAGCNLKCDFCQNWEISQKKPEEVNFIYTNPEEIVRQAQAIGAPAIAYTYSEPVIFYEYMLDTARIAKSKGIKNIMHSNGYINEEPLKQLCLYLDAANIDLKGFSEEFYAKVCSGSLEPVLKSLKILKSSGVHLEITNLLIPGANDSPELIKRMCLWIKDNLGADTPLHFSRFYPLYKLSSLSPTPLQALERARQIAIDAGLKYVYIGNLPGHQAENTYCPKCNKLVIGRRGYIITENNLEKGRCKFCGENIQGIWQ